MVIRGEQFQVLQEGNSLDFERQLGAHLKLFTLGQPGVDDATLQAVLKKVPEIAVEYGVTTRGGRRLVAELFCRLGSGFASDPMLPLGSAILAGMGENPVDRADILHLAAINYLEDVMGSGDSNLIQALQAAGASPGWNNPAPEPEMAEALRRLYPLKCIHAPQDGLGSLLERLQLVTHQQEVTSFSLRRQLAAALLLFGADVTHDPLHSSLMPMLRHRPADGFVQYCRDWADYLAT